MRHAYRQTVHGYLRHEAVRYGFEYHGGPIQSESVRQIFELR